jgi:hypothetical protein
MLFFCLPESFWDRTPRQVTGHGDIMLEDRPGHLGILPDPTEDPATKKEGGQVVVSVSSIPQTPSPPNGLDSKSGFDDAAMRQRRSSKQLELGLPDKSSTTYVEYANESQTSTPPNGKSSTTFVEYANDSQTSTPPNGKTPSTTKESYTDYWRSAPKKSYTQSLAPYAGRISNESWTKALIRPFILFAYPSVLWSALVYSLSVGWLIVLSESVSEMYRNSHTYNFTSFQVGLVYLSAFTGGVLGTALAGKVSDFIVRFMARRNGGVFEPEFRLVMAAPVAICSVAGLMGFGWSVEEHDNWIVPTVFFGIISFGCSLGSTTAITFCVDSYRQYAGEALVTLNFSKSKSPLCPAVVQWKLQEYMLMRSRYFSWTSLLPFLSRVAREGWQQKSLHCPWVCADGLFDVYNSYVYLWEEGAHVDGEERYDAEFLKTPCYLSIKVLVVFVRCIFWSLAFPFDTNKFITQIRCLQ